ncbi:MAG: hypothetical protein IH962_05205 [Chloroflexi bacterium]|nr:hypothetical protein [Chloroflexota bacterium]
MSDGVSNTVVLALFLLVTTLSFYYLLDTWGAQNAVTEESVDRQLARLSASISIQSTVDTGSDCKTYDTQIENNGDTLVADYAEMDVLVQYTDTSNTWIVSRLAYPTDWTIALSPDDRDPNIAEKLLAESQGILAWAIAGAHRAAEGEPDLRTGKKEFHDSFRDWSKGRCCTQPELSPRMKRRGFEEGKVHGGRGTWIGISLSAKNLQFDGETWRGSGD